MEKAFQGRGLKKGLKDEQEAEAGLGWGGFSCEGKADLFSLELSRCMAQESTGSALELDAEWARDTKASLCTASQGC